MCGAFLGSGQSAIINQAFANPLVVTVTANDPNVPVAGGQITFTAPTSGASAALSDRVADEIAAIVAHLDQQPSVDRLMALARGA